MCFPTSLFLQSAKYRPEFSSVLCYLYRRVAYQTSKLSSSFPTVKQSHSSLLKVDFDPLLDSEGSEGRYHTHTDCVLTCIRELSHQCGVSTVKPLQQFKVVN